MRNQNEERIRQVIHGVCPSKSNCYRIGAYGLFKTDALKKYEDAFFIQCNHYRNANITSYFEIHVDVFYPNERSDLDNAMKVILDCLQRTKTIKNDNRCVKIVAQKFKDKEKPRIEFEIVRV
jgi:Holliday junction resolvase RusA-like endonuclease